jgi:hypothetical protein
VRMKTGKEILLDDCRLVDEAEGGGIAVTVVGVT